MFVKHYAPIKDGVISPNILLQGVNVKHQKDHKSDKISRNSPKS